MTNDNQTEDASNIAQAQAQQGISLSLQFNVLSCRRRDSLNEKDCEDYKGRPLDGVVVTNIVFCATAVEAAAVAVSKATGDGLSSLTLVIVSWNDCQRYVPVAVSQWAGTSAPSASVFNWSAAISATLVEIEKAAVDIVSQRELTINRLMTSQFYSAIHIEVNGISTTLAQVVGLLAKKDEPPVQPTD